MKGMDKSSRRAFFVRGGAALGAGVATAGASLAGSQEPGADEAGTAAQREAIRALQQAFNARLEAGTSEATARLFTGQARLDLGAGVVEGRARIAALLHSGSEDVTHAAHRPNAGQQRDEILVGPDGRCASARWHVDARIITPLQGDCTAAQMARLQGMHGDVRWESGIVDVAYVQQDGRWLIDSLQYRPA